MPRRTSRTEATPVRVVIVTLDNHLAGCVKQAAKKLSRELPGLSLQLHAATNWKDDPDSLEQCRDDISNGDIIIVTMLFMEEHIEAVMPWLQTRRESCDAMIVGMSAGEVIRLTRVGRFSMDGTQSGVMSLLKRLRGSRKCGSSGSGAQQMAMLRRIPKILRFVPGTAQDLRAYFLTLQYWLAGSEENIRNLVCFLIDRYASGPRESLRGNVKSSLPAEYPDVGLYHPALHGRLSEDVSLLPALPSRCRGTVGLVLMRSYLLAGNTAHYDATIETLEARGLRVIPVFASGLDARPAIDRFWFDGDRPIVDAVISLTGFSLVGGPAYNDADAAKDLLAKLDVPYIAAHAIEFQTLEQWQTSDRGLLPVESTIMVAIPELEGATGPIVFGGRSEKATDRDACDMQPHRERIETLADRVERLVTLRHGASADRKVAIVLFNFPPNAGNTGTAAFLSVFESLHRLLQAMSRAGYAVDVPPSVDALRDRIVAGNADRFGAHANVHCRIPVDDHVRRESWLSEIEAQWGPAPGRQQSDGASLFVLGAQFGNVFVGVQPSMGYEGDPMRLLFESGFAPTHAFSGFYRYLREDFGADAILHFGTHGALEFMPGKQTGPSSACWPDRLIGEIPNLYLYAANNPSEGTIAKRRSAATLISYLTPSMVQAGLYRGLLDLKSSLDRWRSLPPDSAAERDALAPVIHDLAVTLDLADPESTWSGADEAAIAKLSGDIVELETSLIPNGLHVVGEAMGAEERVDTLLAMVDANHRGLFDRAVIENLVAGKTIDLAASLTPEVDSEAATEILRDISATERLLAEDHEIPAILAALEGRFVKPAPGGDLLRNPAILPTGRNIHSFDPFRIPSAFAVAEGARQAAQLLERHEADGNGLPETIAVVLWGSDNLKNEGAPIAQALALIGAKPRFDSFGRLAGAALIPIEDLGRPRIDVVMTLSGIFRDLLPLQTKLLAEAASLAAHADEPLESNYIRKHALDYAEAHGYDLETAALRVFSNADGAYGSNVNLLVDNGRWEDEDELGETYTQRKCFAYGREGQPVRHPELLNSILSSVQLAYQNLESTELGVTSIDHYFDTLGGISRAARRAGGDAIPVYISDQTHSDGKVRTLNEQVALETRTRALNPRWYEGMLQHGYEGVQQIESHITNTMGWSATTGQVDPWVYQQLTQTYVLDDAMRERIASLNPTASAKVANRLLEASERRYWSPDDDVLDALRRAGDELEDRLEGIDPVMAA
jgi:magnesium chelatase subunit H